MRQDRGEGFLGRLSVVKPLDPRVEHPIHETTRLFKIEAESFAHRLTESDIGQPFVAGATHRAQNGAAPAAYASRMVLPPSMQSSLPAGWLAFTGRASNPLDHNKRFQITLLFRFPGLILALSR
jgi:hypothetical protein